MLVTFAILGPDGWSSNPNTSWIILGVFLVEATFGTGVVGGSFGQLLMRIRVVRLDGRPLELLPALLRSALICVVIPPLIFREDGRGLHDLAVGSHVVRIPPRAVE